MTYRLFAAAAPGLEKVTQQELAALGIAAGLPQNATGAGDLGDESGGVEFEGSLSDLYRVNLHLRTANRILARLGDFDALSFLELRRKAAYLPWEECLISGRPVALRVTCRKSRLYHSGAVAERVAGAIADRLGQPVQAVKFNEDAAPLPQLVVVRFLHDHCTISVDTSGALLHRRGYRLETAKAPLRETLAAGLLLASGWNADAPLIDPFCGSGTIAIEAACMARRIPPGKERRFAFMDWPNYDPALWNTLLAAAVSHERTEAASISASDRDAGAVRMAQANAERAGVLGDIQFTCQAVSAIEPPAGPGWLVMNPPYGVRVSVGHDLRNLYARLGDVLRLKCPSWRVGILCADQKLVGQTRLSFEESIPLVNGGIPVRLYLGSVK